MHTSRHFKCKGQYFLPSLLPQKARGAGEPTAFWKTGGAWHHHHRRGADLDGRYVFFGGEIAAKRFWDDGKVILVVGMAVGLSITFYAMIKYNKGIF